ncbi:MAG TPA: hypothetical protein DCW60_02820 [Sutterella sp.]|nr:hypothetical protein [Sutterella sp.]
MFVARKKVMKGLFDEALRSTLFALKKEKVVKETVLEVLGAISDPVTGAPVAKVAKIVADTDAKKARVTFGYPIAKAEREAFLEQASKALRAHNLDFAIDIEVDVKPRAVRVGAKRVDGVRNIIAVASGKGGVGKSTVTANLAAALAAQGARVGVLDADLYGPSQHILFGLRSVPVENDGARYIPSVSCGVSLMTLGQILEEGSPAIWRGPLAAKTLEDIFKLTAWGELDYLFIDLPPGTGDIQITLAQSFPLTAAVVVTTPQDLSTEDASRAIALFEKTSIPVLGIVENMATYRCPHCGAIERIFGEGGAARLAKRTGLEVLASLPLEAGVVRESDAGVPVAIANTDSDAGVAFFNLSQKVAAGLCLLPPDLSSRLPRIVSDGA